MGYYNQALTDYVGKICDVERELYTTQRLIADLDYQMQRLGHPREVDPPEPTDGGNPFVQNGGWYMVFLLGIPISGVVRSISLGIVIAIALGVFGTVWGNIYQRAADREIRNEKWAKYDSAVAADKKRVEKERAYRKQLQSEKELLLQQQAKLEQARARLYSRGTIHEAYRSLIPMACFHHYLSTGITNTLEGKKGCYDRFDEDSWRHAVLTNLQQAVRELRKLQQVNQGLYECLNQSNHTLNRIEQGNQRIYGQLDAVRTNTELTAYNSRVSALANSAMTYMYYDRNYR